MTEPTNTSIGIGHVQAILTGEERKERAVIKIQSLFRGRRARRQAILKRKLNVGKPPVPGAGGKPPVGVRPPGGVKPPGSIPTASHGVAKPQLVKPPSGIKAPGLNDAKMAGVIAPSQVYVTELEEKILELKCEIERQNSQIARFQKDFLRMKEETEFHQAEVKKRELQIVINNEKITELNDTISDKDAEMKLQVQETKDKHRRIQMMQIEIDELNEQIQGEGDEFDQLGDLLKQKDEVIQKKVEEMYDLNQQYEKEQNEVSRLKVIIARLEKRVEELTPETADACLSARSFEENQLIKLRDDALEGKTKELWLLKGQNDRLMAQMDSIEAEMEQLQQDMIRKDKDMAKKEKELYAAKKTVEELQTVSKQAKGREKAMEVAMSQNTQLLQRLQIQDVETDKLLMKFQETTDELTALKAKHNAHLTESATWKVQAEHKSKLADQKSSTLSALQTKVINEREMLHNEMEDLRSNCRVKVESMQQELSNRRDKQYQLLQKLQTMEEELHRANEELEELREEVEPTKLRMNDMEQRLNEARRWREATTVELEFLRKSEKENSTTLKQELKTNQEEKDAMRRQLQELQSTLYKQIDKQKETEVKTSLVQKTVVEKEKVISELKDRVARLVLEATREGKARAHADLEHGLVKEQLNEVHAQMHQKIELLQQGNAESNRKTQLLEEQYSQLSNDLKDEKRGKFRIIKLYTRLIRNGGKSDQNQKNNVLQFPDCRLSDSELEEICRALSTAPNVTRLDLRGNQISNKSISILMKLFEGPHQKFSYLDLRQNMINTTGIRELASLLGDNKQWKNSEIVVHSDGRIELFNDLIQYRAGSSTNAPPDLVIDVRNNDAETTTTKVPLVKKKRRSLIKKKEDGSPDPTAEVYSDDLVETFLGKPKRRNSSRTISTPETPDDQSQQSPRHISKSSSLPSLHTPR